MTASSIVGDLPRLCTVRVVHQRRMKVLNLCKHVLAVRSAILDARLHTWQKNYDCMPHMRLFHNTLTYGRSLMARLLHHLVDYQRQ
jgi:hypothetical protein